MLLLKELPTQQSLEKFSARYPNINMSAIVDFIVLLRASSDISQALDNLLAQHGLLQGRWWLLILLLREEGYVSSPTQLATKAGISKASITGFIDSLEREGLVKRIDDPQDRRKYLIQLTALGLQKLDSTIPDYSHRVGQFMTVLNTHQREALLDAIKTLVNHLQLLVD